MSVKSLANNRHSVNISYCGCCDYFFGNLLNKIYLQVFDREESSYVGFPGSSAGKESTCNAGDPSSGRFPGEGIGYPLQYSWAALVAQIVKNLPAMQETWVLSWEDPQLRGHNNPFQYSFLENPSGQRNLTGYTSGCCKESDTTE